jgi:hypothetical protein
MDFREELLGKIVLPTKAGEVLEGGLVRSKVD